MTDHTEYPYYMVEGLEGRWFVFEDYDPAVRFASSMANRMRRPVSLIRVLD